MLETHGAPAYSTCHSSAAVVRQERAGTSWLRAESCAVRRLLSVALLGTEPGSSAAQTSVAQDPPSICKTTAAGHPLDSFGHAAHTSTPGFFAMHTSKRWKLKQSLTIQHPVDLA